MTDITESVAIVYRSLRQVLDDANKLGRDFGQALREEKLDLTQLQEYSHSPNTFSLKRNHAWFYTRPPEEGTAGSPKVLTFAACFVYFEADRGRWKLSEIGCPELWFFIGQATPPPTGNWAATTQTFFDAGEEQHYDPKPALGQLSYYEYLSAEKWTAVALGYELGAIDSAGALKTKAVQPLVAAATKRALIS